MPVYLAPGVYVEEFDSGPVPMAGGATAVPAFVGFTERVPKENDSTDEDAADDYKPRLVTSWTQFQQFYGGFGNGDWKLGHRPMLPPAVLGYFDNGGSRAYIVPLEWRQLHSSSPELDLPSTNYAEYREDSKAKGIPKALPHTWTKKSLVAVRQAEEDSKAAHTADENDKTEAWKDAAREATKKAETAVEAEELASAAESELGVDESVLEAIELEKKALAAEAAQSPDAAGARQAADAAKRPITDEQDSAEQALTAANEALKGAEKGTDDEKAAKEKVEAAKKRRDTATEKVAALERDASDWRKSVEEERESVEEARENADEAAEEARAAAEAERSAKATALHESEPEAEDIAMVVRTKASAGEVAIAIEPSVKEPDNPALFGMRVRVDGKEFLYIPELPVDDKEKFKGEVARKLREKEVKDKAFPRDLVRVEPPEVPPRRGRYTLARPEPTVQPLETSNITGDIKDQTGIDALKLHEDVTMLIVPDLYNVARCKALRNDPDGKKKAKWEEVDLQLWKDVQTAMITHCERSPNRMAILDPPPIMKRADQISNWRIDRAMYDSQHAAMYYPWIQINDAVEGGSMFVPPGGHMAGVWAKTDATRGVWKAPANEVIRGATGVHYTMTSAEQEVLNPYGINAIRGFPGRGTRVWGARTLTSNALWHYVPVRRLFSWVEKTIMDNTQWVVFEPNDQVTWDRVTRTVSNFLLGLWRDGALFGDTPEKAFYVKCNADTNPPDSRDQGKLICEVGIAPVKPAEFVVFRVTQWQPEA